MTQENSWPIPSFTCSLNFANCRLRAGSFAKQLSSSLRSLSATEREVKMDGALSDSFEDISGDECEALKEYHDDEHQSAWSACKSHQICAMGTETDSEDAFFDVSPASPIDGEIVINPPVPLPPLINSSHVNNDRIGKYGSTDSCGNKDLAAGEDTNDECDSGHGSCSVKVPKLLSAVSSHLTIMIGRDVPFYVEADEMNSRNTDVCVSEARIVLTGKNGHGSESLAKDPSLEFCENNISDVSNTNINASESDSKNRNSDSMTCENRQTGKYTLSLPNVNRTVDAEDYEHLQTSDSDSDLQRNENEIGSEEMFQFDDLDEGAEEEKRVTLQRSTSLKSGKTPPDTPHIKKIVRFADAMGLDLEAVKQITQEDLPMVPKSAYEDLELPDLYDSPIDSPVGSYISSSPSTRKMYVPFEPTRFSQLIIADDSARNLQTLFTVPGIMPNFLERVKSNKISLERVTVSELSITCVVRVANIHFEKKVIARFTTNEWASFDDMCANYIQGSNSNDTDQFSFTIFAPFMSIGQRLCFALKYVAGESEYWDNNFDSNYCFKCQSEYSDVVKDETNGWLHFL